ncbi:amino acid permease-domain-containing protein [Polychytrium aggregatum]|uniref:amino acid permease-domain-containing protein n=1 Tax=Polychytrium aggregatum TaxID=110093 RepID=UPI0022FDBC55|nr:amino acid permease-domain-containing protein [Polychytrium aggregatum]KAI9204586.1 amino acid permease-domain-containing protein [Polychytrium aggregatum]
MLPAFEDLATKGNRNQGVPTKVLETLFFALAFDDTEPAISVFLEAVFFIWEDLAFIGIVIDADLVPALAAVRSALDPLNFLSANFAQINAGQYLIALTIFFVLQALLVVWIARPSRWISIRNDKIMLDRSSPTVFLLRQALVATSTFLMVAITQFVFTLLGCLIVQFGSSSRATALLPYISTVCDLSNSGYNSLAIQIIAFVFAMPLFFVLLALYLLVAIRADPAIRSSPLTKMHSRFDAVYILVRLLMVSFAAIGRDMIQERMIANSFGAFVMLCAVLRLHPYFWPAVNQIRAALLTGAVFMALAAFGLQSTSSLSNWAVIGISIAVVGAGCGTGYGLALLSAHYLKIMFCQRLQNNQKIFNRFFDHDAELSKSASCVGQTKPGQSEPSPDLNSSKKSDAEVRSGTLPRKPKEYDPTQLPYGLQTQVFNLWTDVELSARLVAIVAAPGLFTTARRLSTEEIKLVKDLFRKGSQEYNHPGVLISSVKYERRLRIGTPDSIWNQICKAEFAPGSIDMRLLVKAEVEMAKESGGEVGHEYDNFLQNARSNHVLTCQVVIDCWRFIQNNPDRLYLLPLHAEKLVKIIQITSESYRNIIRRWPSNTECQKMYMSFLSAMRNDGVFSEEDQEKNGSHDSFQASASKLRISMSSGGSQTYSEKRSVKLHRHSKLPSEITDLSMTSFGSRLSRSSKESGRSEKRRALELRTELDNQAKWNIDAFSTTIKLAAIGGILMLCLNLYLLLSFRDMHTQQLTADWGLCYIEVASSIAFMGLRRMINMANGTETADLAKFDAFRMRVAVFSNHAYSVAQNIWAVSGQGNGEKQELILTTYPALFSILPTTTKIVSRNVSFFSIIARMFNFASRVSDISLADQKQILSSGLVGSSALVNMARFVFHNVGNTTNAWIPTIESVHQSWIGQELIERSDHLGYIYLVLILIWIAIVVFCQVIVQGGIFKLIKQQNRALELFKCIPKSIISDLIVAAEKNLDELVGTDIQESLSSLTESYENMLKENGTSTDKPSDTKPPNPEAASSLEGSTDFNSARRRSAVFDPTNKSLPPSQPKPENTSEQAKRPKSGKGTEALLNAGINSKDDWNRRYLSKERYSLCGLMIFQGVCQIALFAAMITVAQYAITDLERLGMVCTTESATLRSLSLVFEGQYMDRYLWSSTAELSDSLANAINNTFEMRNEVFSSWVPRSTSENEILFGTSCLAYNTTLCNYRQTYQAVSPQTIATTRGLVALLDQVLILLDRANQSFPQDMATFSATLQTLDDIAVNDLIDAMSALRANVLQQGYDNISFYFQIILGIWGAGFAGSIIVFFVIHTSVTSIQANLSKTWEILSLIPSSVHDKLPTIGSFINRLNQKTIAERDPISVFYGYCVGKGGTLMVTKPSRPDPIELHQDNFKEGRLSGMSLWMRKEFYRNIYPTGSSFASKLKMFYRRRRLAPLRIGSIHAWALATVVVITGEQSGWNDALADGGYGSLILSTLVGALNYLCVALSLADLQDECPRAIGGMLHYARSHGFHDVFIFISKCSELFEYLLFMALINVSIAGYLQSIFNTSSTMQLVHSAFLVICAFGAVMFLEKRTWMAILVMCLLSIAILVGYIVIGMIYFNPTMLFQGYASNLSNLSIRAWFPGGVSGLGLSLMPGLWWYTGLESATAVTQEMKEPTKNTRHALLGSWVTLLLLAIFMTVFSVGVVPGATQIGQASTPSVATTLALFGNSTTSNVIANLLLLPASISNLLALTLVCGRLMWAMSMSAYFPKWISVTAKDEDHSGHPPLRAYALALTISFALSTYVIVYQIQTQETTTNFSPPNVMLYGSILAALCFYITVGAVQIKKAIFPLGHLEFKNRLWCFSRGFMLVNYNVLVLSCQLAWSSEFLMSFWTFVFVLILMLLYYFVWAHKRIIPFEISSSQTTAISSPVLKRTGLATVSEKKSL